MARIHHMPPDTRDREKIIGGILDIRQLFWICLGLGIYAILVLTLYKFLNVLILILGFPFVVLGFLFALKKVEDLPLPTYLRYKILYKFKTKYFINAGFKDKLEFTPDPDMLNEEG